MGQSAVGSHILTAGRPASVSVLTAPHAVCKISATSTIANGSNSPLAAYADGNGHLHFMVDSTEPTNDSVKLTVAWESIGNSGSRDLDLQFVTDERTPRTISETPEREPWGAVIAAPFSEAEAIGASAADIRSKRLPPRPDSKRTPRLFETWMEFATREMIWVPPVPLSGQPRGSSSLRGPAPPRGVSAAQSATSPNWSGAVLFTGFDQVQAVSGYWKVPPVTGEPSYGVLTEEQHMFQWVGIDGLDQGPKDLVQAGTEGSVQITLGGLLRIATYRAWTELLPLQTTSQILSNFNIAAGDSVLVHVDAAFDQKTGVLAGNFSLLNQSSGQATSSQTLESFPAGVAPFLSAAEWIVERPTYSGNYAYLANYGSTDMEDCAAVVSGVTVGYKGDPTMSLRPYTYSMVDDQGVTLSNADTQTSIIQLNWQAKGHGEAVP